MERNFMELLRNRWKIGRCLSVGLDSDTDLLPALKWNGEPSREAQFIFNRAIVDATYRWVAAYKPNFWFYASEGESGLYVLGKTIRYIHEQYPAIPVILDLKSVDIGNTSKKIAKLAFDMLRADAVTVHPYLGREGALEPFLERTDKGIFVLARTSNPGAEDFQGEIVHIFRGKERGLQALELFKLVAEQVAHVWNTNGNCGLVMGATWHLLISDVRNIIGEEVPILIPGVGAQGGELEKVVRAARDGNGSGFIINASRSVIFASKENDFAKRAGEEAKRLHNAISKVLKEEKGNGESK